MYLQSFDLSYERSCETLYIGSNKHEPFGLFERELQAIKKIKYIQVQKEETQTKLLIALYLTRSDLGAEGLFERDLPPSVALAGVTAQGPVRTILSVLDPTSFLP